MAMLVFFEIGQSLQGVGFNDVSSLCLIETGLQQTDGAINGAMSKTALYLVSTPAHHPKFVDLNHWEGKPLAETRVQSGYAGIAVLALSQ